MARPKRRTQLETFFFSGIPYSEEQTDLCRMQDMAVPGRIMDDPMKKQLWDFICADMEHRRCLSTTYNLLIAELVEVIALMHKCRESLDKQGLVLEKVDEEGNYLGSIVNPYQTILSRQQPHLIKLLEKIGMSPRDITYLVNPEATNSTPLIEAGVVDYAKISYFRT